MNLKTYKGATQEPQQGETIFYIQSHGNHAGRPLRTPKTNCWEYRTTRPQDFEILTIVFESRILENFITGSVIPFIPLQDYKKIITPILKKGLSASGQLNEKYLQIRKIEQFQQLTREKERLLTQAKKIICQNTIKELL